MQHIEHAQLAYGVAALNVQQLGAQLLAAADGAGVQVKLRLCGAHVHVRNAQDVGHGVGVVVVFHACVLNAAAQQFPGLSTGTADIHKDHVQFAVSFLAGGQVDSSFCHGYSSSR